MPSVVCGLSVSTLGLLMFCSGALAGVPYRVCSRVRGPITSNLYRANVLRRALGMGVAKASVFWIFFFFCGTPGERGLVHYPHGFWCRPISMGGAPGTGGTCAPKHGRGRRAVKTAAAAAATVQGLHERDRLQIVGACVASACLCDAPWMGPQCTHLRFALGSNQ